MWAESKRFNQIAAVALSLLGVADLIVLDTWAIPQLFKHDFPVDKKKPNDATTLPHVPADATGASSDLVPAQPPPPTTERSTLSNALPKRDPPDPDDMVRVTIPFATNVWRKRCGSVQSSLLPVVSAARGMPNLVIQIHGHADERGEPIYNKWLSWARAEAIQTCLEAQGVDRERIQTHAHGAAAPLVRTRSPAAWSENRRVEIVAKAMPEKSPMSDGGGRNRE